MQNSQRANAAQEDFAVPRLLVLLLAAELEADLGVLDLALGPLVEHGGAPDVPDTGARRGARLS
jgi:hypothetical protein